jgi:hypothetical protein
MHCYWLRELPKEEFPEALFLALFRVEAVIVDCIILQVDQ